MTLRYLPLPLWVRRITELNQVLDLHQSFDCPLVLLITTSGSVLTACHYVHMSSGQSGEHPLQPSTTPALCDGSAILTGLATNL